MPNANGAQCRVARCQRYGIRRSRTDRARSGSQTSPLADSRSMPSRVRGFDRLV